MVRNVSVVVGFFLLASVLVSVSVQTLTAQSSDGNTIFELDYLQYRETIEPIFLNRRPGNARCVVCHSQGGGNSFLEPLPPGREAYAEEQSIRNFERVQRLVVPGQPLESILLVNPLTEDAGGSHWHAGGKHWESQDHPEWRALAAWVGNTTVGVDFDFYRSRVEPIFLNRRPGNARCVVCHSQGGGNSFLEPLPPGRDVWDEEQSFRNFQRVRRLVTPGAPLESILLVNPLTEDAGGSHWHAGGKHWESQDNVEWQTLAAWVTGQTSR